MTGKGDRWGRNEYVGLSPLPSGQHHRNPSINLHCTARGRPTSSAAVVVLRGRPTSVAVVVSLRPVPGRLPAGCVHLQWLCSAGYVCLLAFAMPTALLILPPFILLCPHLFVPCAPGSSVQATSFQAARLSRWQQQRGSAVAARAPCCFHHTITGAAKTACRQPQRGDCIWAAHAPLSATP